MKQDKRKAKWIIAIVAVCILIYLAIKNIGVLYSALCWAVGLISPLVVGFVFALIFNVPMVFFERHLFPKNTHKAAKTVRRPLAMVLSMVLVFGILVGAIWLVIPELVDAIIVIINGAIQLLGRLEDLDLSQLADNPVGNLLATINWDAMGEKLQNWLTVQGGNLVNTAVGTISSVLGGVVNFVISFIFAIYILANKEKLKKLCCRLIRVWLPSRFGEWFIHACSVASGNFRNFVSGQTLEALILGCLCMIGMWILRIPYAPMVGALVGVTALIPVVGAFAGAIIGAFMILTVSPMKALLFLVFLIILQQIEGNLIYPKVMGSRVNLPAMWVLAAVTLGGGLAGPIGMLLSVPVAATAYVLIKEATAKREEKLAIQIQAEKEPEGAEEES